MALTVSIHQAVSTALQGWIASQITDAVVNDKWPEPSVGLPPKSISILQAGAPQFTWLDEVMISAVPASGNNYTYTYRAAQVELNLQLSVFATAHVLRDDLIARLEVALHASKAQTLAAFLAAQGNTDSQPVLEDEIALQLAAPWNQVLCGYRFDTPALDDSAEAGQRRDYSATFRGVATYDWIYQVTAPRLLLAQIRQFMTTQSNLSPPAGTPIHITTSSSTGPTTSKTVQSDGTAP